MPFVKLDCGILNSTLWFDKMCRDIFITALLMAEPYELEEPSPQLEVCSLTETGWSVPRGWYGLVHAAGVGILHRAGVNEGEHGKAALTRLGAPEPDSRSKGFDGRRLVRIDGGYIVLNYMIYRERDYTSADRSRRYRAKRRDEAINNQTRAETVALLAKRDDGRCGICGRHISDLAACHLDHIRPLSLGGNHHLDNLQLAHGPCNNGKGGHAEDVQSWRHDSLPATSPRRDNSSSRPDITQAEAEAEVQEEEKEKKREIRTERESSRERETVTLASVTPHYDPFVDPNITQRAGAFCDRYQVDRKSTRLNSSH